MQKMIYLKYRGWRLSGDRYGSAYSIEFRSTAAGRLINWLMWTVPRDRAPFTAMPLILATGMDSFEILALVQPPA